MIRLFVRLTHIRHAHTTLFRFCTRPEQYPDWIFDQSENLNSVKAAYLPLLSTAGSSPQKRKFIEQVAQKSDMGEKDAAYKAFVSHYFDKADELIQMLAKEQKDGSIQAKINKLVLKSLLYSSVADLAVKVFLNNEDLVTMLMKQADSDKLVLAWLHFLHLKYEMHDKKICTAYKRMVASLTELEFDIVLEILKTPKPESYIQVPQQLQLIRIARMALPKCEAYIATQLLTCLGNFRLTDPEVSKAAARVIRIAQSLALKDLSQHKLVHRVILLSHRQKIPHRELLDKIMELANSSQDFSAASFLLLSPPAYRSIALSEPITCDLCELLVKSLEKGDLKALNFICLLRLALLFKQSQIDRILVVLKAHAEDLSVIALANTIAFLCRLEYPIKKVSFWLDKIRNKLMPVSQHAQSLIHVLFHIKGYRTPRTQKVSAFPYNVYDVPLDRQYSPSNLAKLLMVLGKAPKKDRRRHVFLNQFQKYLEAALNSRRWSISFLMDVIQQYNQFQPKQHESLYALFEQAVKKASLQEYSDLLLSQQQRLLLFYKKINKPFSLGASKTPQQQHVAKPETKMILKRINRLNNSHKD